MVGLFLRGALVAAALCSLATVNAFADPTDDVDHSTAIDISSAGTQGKRPVIGLVLSGGGAKGIAHVAF